MVLMIKIVLPCKIYHYLLPHDTDTVMSRHISRHNQSI